MFRKLCGETTLRNVVIVTNMWGGGSRDINEARERELRDKFFRPAIDKGAQIARHSNTVQSAHDIIRTILQSTVRHPPVALRIQYELVDKSRDIVDTTAGKVINRELNEQTKRHQAELREVREEMQRALREKDEQTRRELEEEARRLQERMVEIARDERGMSAGYAAEKERVEARIKAVERGVQKREQDEANHTHDPPDETNVADRVGSGQQTKRPQDLTGTPTTISPDNLAHHGTTPSTTREIVSPPRRHQSLPLHPHTPSSFTTPHATSCVQAISCLAPHHD